MNSYRYVYKILVDYARRRVAGFFFQFSIYRNLEVASLLIVTVMAGITEINPAIVICVVGVWHLLASLITGESYLKIVPYIRVIYLNTCIVSLYLLLNTFAPFSIYLLLLAATMPSPQQSENFLLMAALLFNNTLFAHILHLFSFARQEIFLYLLLMIILYLEVYFQANLLHVLIISILIVIFFIYKIRNY